MPLGDGYSPDAHPRRPFASTRIRPVIGDPEPPTSEDAPVPSAGAPDGETDEAAHEAVDEAVDGALRALAGLEIPADPDVAARHVAAAAAAARAGGDVPAGPEPTDEVVRPLKPPRGRRGRTTAIIVTAGILAGSGAVAALVRDDPVPVPSAVAAPPGAGADPAGAGPSGANPTRDGNTGPADGAPDAGQPRPGTTLDGADPSGEGGPGVDPGGTPGAPTGDPTSSVPTAAGGGGGTGGGGTGSGSGAPPSTGVAPTTSSPTTLPQGPPPPLALLATGAEGCGGQPNLSVSGPGSRLRTNGTVASNCPAGNALVVDAGATVSAARVVLAGAAGGGGAVTPRPVTGAAATIDPFAGLPAIGPGTDCTPADPSQHGCAVQPGVEVSGTATLSPGRYQGPVKVAAGADVTLQAGIYEVGGLIVEPGSHLRGQGVTIVVGSGAIEITGCAELVLSPPTSGPYAGVTLHQPTSNHNAGRLARSAGCNWSFTGSLHAPRAQVEVTGALTFLAATLVVNDLEWNGVATVDITR